MNNSEEVSLSFSEFYDGGQLFKSKSTNYWILMTHILNLPPTSRGKLGIGMFLKAKGNIRGRGRGRRTNKKRARLHSSNERNQEASSSVEHPALK
jgi:hypothetical protein